MNTPNDPTPSNRPTPDGAPLRDSVYGTGIDAGFDEEFDLDDELNIVAGHLNTQHARLVDLTVAMIANPRAWRGPGVHSPELFLAWRTGLSAQRARQIVAIANRVSELPHCIDAFRRGQLAIDQMFAIAKRAPWWIDNEICDLGCMLTVNQLTRTLATYPFPDHPHPDTPTEPAATEPAATEPAATEPGVAEPAAGEPADGDGPDDGAKPTPTGPAKGEPAPKDRMWFGLGDDGRWRLQVETDQLTGMTIETALREALDQLFQDGHPDIEWIDALREICQRSLGTITGAARRDRYRIHVDLKADGQCCDDRGWNLPDAIRQYITCDGLLTPTFLDGAIPISIGRTGRMIPQRTRRLVILRDGGCAVPGCTQTHIIEVHHIIHWENGGSTDTWNLIALCPHHHRMHHKGELGISGNADDGTVIFTDRNGDLLRPTGAKPKPPGAPPPPAPSRYAHPLGERLDTQYLHFREPGTRRDHAA